MMLVDGVFALSGRAGDLLGSWIYRSGEEWDLSIVWWRLRSFMP